MDILKKFRVVEDQVEENLSRNQKLAVTGLVILGFILIIYWGVGMKNNIYQPLGYDAKKTATQANSVITEDEKLKSQDTDKDGLSDWDEVNVYGTSPYLEDTDSDGINDGVEIKNHQDPNCPFGKACGQSEVSTEPVDTPVVIPDNPSVSLTKEQVDLNKDNINNLLSGKVDALTLRKLLLSAGADEKIINQMSDQELMGYYNSTLKNTSVTTSTQ